MHDLKFILEILLMLRPIIYAVHGDVCGEHVEIGEWCDG